MNITTAIEPGPGSGIQPASVPRARGCVRLAVKHAEGATRLDRLRQSGSMKVLFPRNAPGGVQAVLINTAGGITGGDAFQSCARAAAQTSLTLTTQAAERAYRAMPDIWGEVHTTLRADSGASLNWLPQETILFDGCALRRRLTVDLEAGARLLLAEPLVFGRAAMGERLGAARLHDRIEIRRGSRPLFVDAVRMDGDIAGHLARAPVAGGAGAMATLVYAADDAETRAPEIRDMLPGTAGSSLIHPDLFCARVLAPDSHALRLSLIPILTRLSGHALPRPWMI